MEINIFDYVSLEEVRSVVKEQIRESVRKDAERILSNTAYSVVFEAVDEALGGESKEIIKNKTLDIINNLSELTVFRRRDAWEREDSGAYKILQETIAEMSPVIVEKIKEIILNFDYASKIDSDLLMGAVVRAIKS